MENKLLNLNEAAQALRVSPWSLRAWAKRGEVKVVRLGRRVLIPREEIERIVREGLPSLRAA